MRLTKSARLRSLLHSKNLRRRSATTFRHLIAWTTRARISSQAELAIDPACEKTWSRVYDARGPTEACDPMRAMNRACDWHAVIPRAYSGLRTALLRGSIMFQKPTVADLRQAAQKLGMNPSDDYLNAVEQIITPLANAYAVLDTTSDEIPAVKYPRGQFHRPSVEENPHGAWYVKTSIKGKPGGKLAGRRVALKDNVCLAGVPMMIGAELLEGYVPDVDATVVERILDAGGEIAGKAVCEYYCVSGGSHTSSTGPVHNPRKRGYTTGGSSSGSAALVAAGDVDMAIGGDQAGSIRIPASHCGIVGLKPTYGLVPYTGIAPLEITLDTCGPMTADVRDNALLLEVIAGPDGIDSRQYQAKPRRYTDALEGGVKGLRIGVLKEGFGHPNSEPDVDARVRDAAQRLAKLGATVADVS